MDEVLYFSTDLEFYLTRSLNKLCPHSPAVILFYPPAFCILPSDACPSLVHLFVIHQPQTVVTVLPSIQQDVSIPCTASSSTLKKMAVCSCETLALLCHVTQHCIPEDCTRNTTMRVTRSREFSLQLRRINKHFDLKKFVVDILLSVISVQCVGIFIVLSVCLRRNQMKITFTYGITTRWQQ